jgi:CheY-like chemotaxis protein
MDAPFKVLVAEDHEIQRDVLNIIFTALGCVVTTVCDGAEALAVLAEERFDMVCLDRHMPVVDGPTIVSAIGDSIFTVACTSDPSPGLEGFQMVIRKPFCCVDLAHGVVAARAWSRQKKLATLPLHDGQAAWPAKAYVRLRIPDVL